MSLNLGIVGAKLKLEKVRASVSMMAGTYAASNLAEEPPVLKNIYEAQAGFRLSEKHDVWIDAGVMPSHIGFESPLGIDCQNLTRSLMADNSPYYETGIKLSFTGRKWYSALLLLNGWQRIKRQAGNTTPAFGHQLTWKPRENLSLNSSSFVGSDTPDSTRRFRYFHNFYVLYSPSQKLDLTAAFDIGVQQAQKGSHQYHTWYTPLLSLYYHFTDRWKTGLRCEYYRDVNGIQIKVGQTSGFQTLGFSANTDYRVSPFICLRVEAKTYLATEPVFEQKSGNGKVSPFLSSAVMMKF